MEVLLSILITRVLVVQVLSDKKCKCILSYAICSSMQAVVAVSSIFLYTKLYSLANFELSVIIAMTLFRLLANVPL